MSRASDGSDQKPREHLPFVCNSFNTTQNSIHFTFVENKKVNDSL